MTIDDGGGITPRPVASAAGVLTGPGIMTGGRNPRAAISLPGVSAAAPVSPAVPTLRISAALPVPLVASVEATWPDLPWSEVVANALMLALASARADRHADASAANLDALRATSASDSQS